MEDIKMVDTKAQYAKLKPELDAAFSAVMASMRMEEGPQVQEFARTLGHYLQVEYVIPCASGTDALQLALLALQLPEGAEVIIPSFNYESAAEILLKLKLKPVFADVDTQTFNLDPASVERCITPATAAVIPVHLFGQCAPMHELMELASKYKLWVVEDATQSLGAVYVGPDGKEQKAGAIGHISFTAFYPAKPVGGAGDGGAVLTILPELAERTQQTAKDGMGGKYEFSSRLETLQAAMLNVKIKYLDEYNEARQEIARFYDNAFAETELVQAPHRATYSSQTYQQYTIKVPPALQDGLRQYLLDNHIPSAIYYPQPLHLQQIYTSLGYREGDLPVAEMLCRSVLSLPIHSELKEDQLTYICYHVLNYVKQSMV
ncbi:DegT/DnrJ/EryC1/StrS family aminotransferase [Pontibacter korlensis]|uniref:Pleiotropic regulatory protein n=1 Tax=Pontibacter korlensis TaxID=400092 RepID=A0A0E3UY74_9BACT|nr:DegT/DnrJ/EryC1/StrS family aminotransferase [Pontibacter korlensis]AKD04892.1 hypothetical protein PKOR_19570 [Pontibacter korlensis]